MKKGIRAHDVSVKGLDGIIKKCNSADIEYLQLVLEKTIDGFRCGNFDKKYAAELKEKLRGIRIAVLGGYINPSNPDDAGLRIDVEKFKEKIRYASILMPTAVGTETEIYKEGMTNTEEAYQRVLKTFKELTKEAERYDVTIGIEGVWQFVISTPQKMKRLLDDLDSDNVKVIFDPVNYLNINNYKSQNTMINDVFTLLSDKICVLHAKDFIVENGEFKTAKPTEGMLNYNLIFEKMKEYKLDIPIICEELNEDEAKVAFENFLMMEAFYE